MSSLNDLLDAFIDATNESLEDLESVAVDGVSMPDDDRLAEITDRFMSAISEEFDRENEAANAEAEALTKAVSLDLPDEPPPAFVFEIKVDREEEGRIGITLNTGRRVRIEGDVRDGWRTFVANERKSYALTSEGNGWVSIAGERFEIETL